MLYDHGKIPEPSTRGQNFELLKLFSQKRLFLRRHTFQSIIGAAELLIEQALALQVT